jgi:alkylation response protein AidB-like acyl-CoA dehydrogenase
MSIRVEGPAASPIEAVQAIRDRVRAFSEEIESERRIPASLVRELSSAGLFRMFSPSELGGAQSDPFTAMRSIEALSQADGSVGWCLLVATNAAWFVNAYFERAFMREIYAQNPDLIVAGSGKATGRAVAVNGGYRVSGEWGFASGCTHSDWMMGCAKVYDGDAPRMLPSGAAETIHFLMPSADWEIIDDWYVSGLRGTGSHTVALRDVFVPKEHLGAPGAEPRRTEPLYRLPLVALASMFGSVALGIARTAIDALVELAVEKTPTYVGRRLREQAGVQVHVGQAEALLRSGRAFLHGLVGEIWETVKAGDTPTKDQRALMLLAATHATASASQAVDLMYAAGGASSIFPKYRLERAFRDVHTVTQYFLVQSVNYEAVGRTMLGLDSGVTYL